MACAQISAQSAPSRCIQLPYRIHGGLGRSLLTGSCQVRLGVLAVDRCLMLLFRISTSPEADASARQPLQGQGIGQLGDRAPRSL
jgi:hypothetical protein